MLSWLKARWQAFAAGVSAVVAIVVAYLIAKHRRARALSEARGVDKVAAEVLPPLKRELEELEARTHVQREVIEQKKAEIAEQKRRLEDEYLRVGLSADEIVDRFKRFRR